MLAQHTVKERNLGKAIFARSYQKMQNKIPKQLISLVKITNFLQLTKVITFV